MTGPPAPPPPGFRWVIERNVFDVTTHVDDGSYIIGMPRWVLTKDKRERCSYCAVRYTGDEVKCVWCGAPR